MSHRLPSRTPRAGAGFFRGLRGLLRCARVGGLLAALMAAALCAAPVAQAAGRTDPTLRVEASAHAGPIRQIAVDRTETMAVTVSDDKTARLWDLKSQALLAVFRVPIGEGKAGGLYGAAISPLGHEVAVAGTSEGGAHRIYTFNLKTGALVRAFDALAGDIKSLTWTLDGRYLVATYAGSHGVRVFDYKGTLWHEKLFSGPSYGAAVSAGGQIAVAAFDGGVHLFSSSPTGITAAGRIELPIADPVSVSFSPDGQSLAVGYYSRNANDQPQVDVLDVASRKVLRTHVFRDVRHGNLMQVAWSQDGKTVYAAGTGYRRAERFLMKAISWPSGDTEETELAGNSVTKLLALPGGRLVFSTFEPSWGVFRDGQVQSRLSPATSAVQNASSLKASADGAIVGWTAKGGDSPVVFDLKQRAFVQKPAAELREVRVSALFNRDTVWENTRSPRINGRPVPLAAEEVSRAFALLPDDSAALLGTSWNLRKLDKSGQELWRVPVGTEVSALNVTGDSRTIVMALADGTVHWLRAGDGRELMSLTATGNGRWVLATPAGHYDASVGAEGLLGWHVNREDGVHADFFSISKFRDKFYRPDVIDRVLQSDSPEAALEAANQALLQQTQSAPADQRAGVDKLVRAKTPGPGELPPTLGLAGSKVTYIKGTVLTIDYLVFSPRASPVTRWQVKVDGRPAQPLSMLLPEQPGGKATGKFSLRVPARATAVQLFVENEFGVSEPLTVDPRAPPVQAAPAPADTPAPPPAPAPVEEEERPTLFVLSVGVAAYADASLNLRFPAKDARDLAQVMQQQEGRRYKKVVSKLLVDRQATRDAVAEALAWLRDSPRGNDVAILFIAGHGVTLPGNLYRFLPHDAKLSPAPDNFITEEQLRDTLVNIKGKAILFIDTCFSGKAVGNFTRHDTKLIANRLSSADSGVIVFSSSDGRQESLENEAWNNGAFTKELVAGLGGKADYRNEGVVTHKGLDYYVSHQVRQLTGGFQTPITTVPIGVPDYPLTTQGAPGAKQPARR